MNDYTEPPRAPNEAPNHQARTSPAGAESARFFLRTDWLSFGMTTALALGGYLLTLAPQVTLGFSGVFSVGAMYAGVPHPPGYPLWTIYAWIFTVLLPFSNVAWRVAVSSAVAGALACGVIALMVSRGGVLIVEAIPGFKRLKPKAESLLRVVSGSVAGLAFGFDGAFWGRAVVADVWPLSVLLLSIVLCSLMRWMQAPDQKRFLCAAFFVYGLTISNSQALLTAAFGLQLLVMFGDRELGRDILFANTILFIAGWAADSMDYLPWPESYEAQVNPLRAIFLLIGIGSVLLCIALTIKTRRFLTKWRTIFVSGVMFVLGASIYFYVPIASMTNPPINWGYARTVTGFFHALTRGQYERVHLTDSFGRLVEQMRMYGEIAVTEFGLVYLFIALVPFCFLRRMQSRERGWVLGLMAVYFCLALLMLVVLNPTNDRQSRELTKVFFSASHLVLAVWTGCGLVLLGSLLARARDSDRSGSRTA